MSVALVLPKRFAGQAEARAQSVRPVPHAGRPQQKSASVWLDELVSLRKALMLCWHCHGKFDHGAAQYHKDTRFPFVWAQCDDCRKHGVQSHLYIHESTLAGPGGAVVSGTAWTPR